MGDNERDFLDEMDLANPAGEPNAAGSETVEAKGEGSGEGEGSDDKGTNPPEAPPQQPAQQPTPEAGAPTAPHAPDGFVPLAALKAEREKRQNYETEISTLRKQLEERPASAAAPAPQADTARAPAPPADFWMDPTGFVTSAVQQVSAESRNQLYAALEDHARTVHTDFDDVMKVVETEAKKHPAIAAEILASPNPALAAYKRGKELMQVQTVLSDPDGYRAKVEAEVRAKLEAEAKAKTDSEAKRKQVADSIPPDLTDSPSGGGKPAGASGDVFHKLFD
ncbi:hypothetical protein [Lysobacter sp. Hz 25]|uniref:hypothetical protein n=1 Tax=Lysobacter sp. Hz 25 TaxID=3383698 RepID=UPI0038D44008